MPPRSTTSWSLFPPRTEEIEFDEKWSFVAKKEAIRADEEPRCGDNWDHVALDAEHRLVLETVPGKRSRAHVREAVQSVKRRLGGRIPRLITSDEFAPYRQEILAAWGVAEPVERTGKPGRPRKPRMEPHPDLLYATVHKTRREGRVVKVEERLQFGTEEKLRAALSMSSASRKVNTAFIERQNGTDRLKNSRKARKTYCFSKDWDVHNASGHFTMYSYNFCWAVRTLREKIVPGVFRERTPAMAAGLADHVWSLHEWLSHPAIGATLN